MSTEFDEVLSSLQRIKIHYEILKINSLTGETRGVHTIPEEEIARLQHALNRAKKSLSRLRKSQISLTEK